MVAGCVPGLSELRHAGRTCSYVEPPPAYDKSGPAPNRFIGIGTYRVQYVHYNISSKYYFVVIEDGRALCVEEMLVTIGHSYDSETELEVTAVEFKLNLPRGEYKLLMK